MPLRRVFYQSPEFSLVPVGILVSESPLEQRAVSRFGVRGVAADVDPLTYFGVAALLASAALLSC